MAKPELTPERLREFLDYNPDAGIFIWRRSSQGARAGAAAGWKHPTPTNTYIVIQVAGFRHYAHRLAWLYMTGRWPKAEIDHRNCCGTDNRWANLREATPSQNTSNAPKRRRNASGLKGVRKNGSGWMANIRMNNKRHYLGTFRSKEAASAAYREAALKLHGEFARFE